MMRVEQGASRWNIPVKADGIAITYRYWWDKISAEQKVWFSYEKFHFFFYKIFFYWRKKLTFDYLGSLILH